MKSSLWQRSNRADPEARAIADRHYNQQKVWSPNSRHPAGGAYEK